MWACDGRACRNGGSLLESGVSRMPEVPPPQPDPQHGPTAGRRRDFLDHARAFLQDYAWFIVRNIIGWVLILAALPLGIVLPGPGGLPIFLIGFALVTFPGKRKLTARVLRGRRLHIEERTFAVVAAFVSIAIPGIAWWIIWERYKEPIRQLVADYTPKRIVFFLTPLLAILITWLVTRLSLKLLNGLLHLLPRFRRKFRPWLRRKGLKLLPPRRRPAPLEPLPQDEILELAPHHQHRLQAGWKFAKPWLKRLAAVAVTVWIITIMLRPLRNNWPQVSEQMRNFELWRFFVASAMFAAFLLVFRAMSWRRTLKGFGYRIPHRSAARIWATSELARYLPGAIWQVVGRVYLTRPYGVPGSIVSTTQVLEVCIFLFANVLVAATCLLWYGQKMLRHSDARPWVILALALVPLLAFVLHPKIFYGIANVVLKRAGKPEIVKRLRGRKLVGLLFWMMLGLVWQSAAVYLIVDPVLHFYRSWWWVMAGAYCLAWIAGFLAFWAPGGIGVRELVFVATMQAILPQRVRDQFDNPAALAGLLVLLGFVLRLWTVVGELMLTGIAYAWDYRGALNRADAPGRVPAELLEGEGAEEKGTPATRERAERATSSTSSTAPPAPPAAEALGSRTP